MFLRNAISKGPISRTMTTLTPVATKSAPPAAASYSQAMRANNLLFVSGQIPYTPDNKPVEGSISDKTEQVFSNVKSILQAGNSSFERVVKVNVFLADIKHFEEFNKVYAKYFSEHQPARSCVAVAALPKNCDLEMEVIAAEVD